MAFTTVTGKGFEFLMNLYGSNVPLLSALATENTAFSKGDVIYLASATRRVSKAAQGYDDIVGVVAEALTTTTNPDASETLIKYIPALPGLIFIAPFDTPVEGTGTSTGSTTLFACTTLTATNDYYIGCFAYCYEGTNKGYFGTVIDSASSTSVTFEKAAPAAFDTTSKVIFLGPRDSATIGGINQFAIGVDFTDENTIDADGTLASENGPMMVAGDYTLLKEWVPKGYLPIMFRKSIYARKDV